MLLPYTSNRPRRNPPVAVVSLVLIHFAVFGIVGLILGVRGPDAAVIWYANLSLMPGSIRPHTFISYAFLHESVFHLSANMLFLWVFGGSVEDVVGWKRFLTLYAIAVVVAGILEFLMASRLGRLGSVSPIVGASGAIAAVIGVFAFRFYRSSIGFIGVPIRIPAVLLLAIVMLGEMGMALIHLTRRDSAFGSQAAAHWAHMGGFLFGILWARYSRASGHGRLEYLEQDARLASERGAFPSAVHRWEELVRLKPTDLEYRGELGRALLGMGESEQAIEHFDAAIKGFLKSGEKTRAGIRYAQMGDFSGRLSLSPSEILAIAGVLEEQSESAIGLTALERILAEHPSSPEAEMARLRTAALYLKMGNPARARERINEYLERHPENELRSFAEDLLRRAETTRDTLDSSESDG